MARSSDAVTNNGDEHSGEYSAEVVESREQPVEVSIDLPVGTGERYSGCFLHHAGDCTYGAACCFQHSPCSSVAAYDMVLAILKKRGLVPLEVNMGLRPADTETVDLLRDYGTSGPSYGRASFHASR